MLQNFSMFQTFSMFQKSLGHRKMSELVCFTNKKFKNDRVPTFFYVFSEKNIEKVWYIEKCWDSVIF